MRARELGRVCACLRAHPLVFGVYFVANEGGNVGALVQELASLKKDAAHTKTTR